MVATILVLQVMPTRLVGCSLQSVAAIGMVGIVSLLAACERRKAVGFPLCRRGLEKSWLRSPTTLPRTHQSDSTAQIVQQLDVFKKQTNKLGGHIPQTNCICGAVGNVSGDFSTQQAMNVFDMVRPWRAEHPPAMGISSNESMLCYAVQHTTTKLIIINT